MVRVNIINPRYLADQHLVAEYLEIIMLISYVRKHPKELKAPKRYCLGTGHIIFFKNKLKYIKRRHEMIKKEMKRRGFATNKTLSLTGIPAKFKKDWRPVKGDKDIIKKRLLWKIKQKPTYYRYNKEKKPLKFFKQLLEKA